MESLFVNGPAGRLEALLEEPGDRDPVEAALVCHPHPQYGGTMHNKVVYRMARGLRRRGVAVLRSNFRGVGRSQERHGNLAGEVEDARAALDWLAENGRTCGIAGPVVVSGWVVGAGVGVGEGAGVGLVVVSGGVP